MFLEFKVLKGFHFPGDFISLTEITSQSNKMFIFKNRLFSHSYIIPEAVAMVLNVQISKVQGDTMTGIHTDHPGTVHVVRIVVWIQRRVNFP